MLQKRLFCLQTVSLSAGSPFLELRKPFCIVLQISREIRTPRGAPFMHVGYRNAGAAHAETSQQPRKGSVSQSVSWKRSALLPTARHIYSASAGRLSQDPLRDTILPFATNKKYTFISLWLYFRWLTSWRSHKKKKKLKLSSQILARKCWSDSHYFRAWAEPVQCLCPWTKKYL